MGFIVIKYRYVVLMVWGYPQYANSCIMKTGKIWHDSEVKATVDGQRAMKEPMDVIDSSYLTFLLEKKIFEISEDS